jgi:tetratricopeptide (TPR) repeat protein
MAQVQMLIDGIDLTQLAEILEISTEGTAAPAAPAPELDLPPPSMSDEAILAASRVEGPPQDMLSASPDEAVFAEDLLASPTAGETQSEAEAPATQESFDLSILDSEAQDAAPVEPDDAIAPATGEETATELPAFASPEERLAVPLFEESESRTQPFIPEQPSFEPVPAPESEAAGEPPAAEADDDADATAKMMAQMMAGGELTEEELRALQEEAGDKPAVSSHADQEPVDELDVLQQLRSVRKDTVRSREREKHEKRKKLQDAQVLAEIQAPDKAARFRLWLFRVMMFTFIILVAMRSEVVIDVPNKAVRFQLLLESKVTTTPSPRLVEEVRRLAQGGEQAGQPIEPAEQPVTPETPPVTPEGTTGQPQPPPNETLSPDLMRSFVERELRMGDLQGAIDLASASLSLDPAQVKQQLFDDAVKAKEGLDRGVAMLMAQNMTGSESVLRKVAETEGPGQALGQYYLGQVLRLQGRADEAQTSFEQAIGLDPKLGEALHGMAQIQRSRGNVDAAVDLNRRAIVAKPAFTLPYHELGDIYKERGSYPEAIAVCQELLAQDPRQSYALFSIGLCQFKQGSFQEAADSFKKALEVNRAWRYVDSGLAQNNLGNCYDNLNQPAAAMAAYEAAARARPNDDVVQYNLARAYQRYEYPEKAIEPYQRAIDLMEVKDPAQVGELYPRAIYNQADCYMRLHDFKAAAERFEEITKLKPELEIAREKRDKAVEAYQKARQFSYYYGTPVVTERTWGVPPNVEP